ncbi:hypothetical protein Plhal304r1_c029g0096601 [Plasmopara halstedii]
MGRQKVKKHLKVSFTFLVNLLLAMISILQGSRSTFAVEMKLLTILMQVIGLLKLMRNKCFDRLLGRQKR